jgi:hypothetical protein
MRRLLVAVFTLGLLFLLNGCSFNRDWKRATNAHPLETRDSNKAILGRWEGTWKSDVNGHTDRLRCIVTRQDAGFRARFHANYKKIFTFTYAVPLQVEQRDGRSHFSGAANLGWYAGGRYQYEGAASATNFTATYRCKSDHGIFQMTRPRP